MYLHVKSAGETGDLETADPFGLIDGGAVELLHSECVGGKISIERGAGTLTLVCDKCDARQELEREEAAEALRRVLLYDEYAWAGDAGFLPD